jgi:hypothetical protein
MEGFDISGNSIGEKQFELAGVTQWTQVSLASLGKVNKIEFSLTGSDTGEYGFNTPAYVCIDDVKIIL